MSDKYLYTFNHKYSFRVEGVNMPHQIFKRESDGAVMFEVYGQDCWIYPGYAFDGCTPKFRIFGKWFGTWDGPLTWFTEFGEMVETMFGKKDWSANIQILPRLYYASGEHDCFCQFKPKGIIRKRADLRFLSAMNKVNFKWAMAYYKAVRFWSKVSGADK